MRIVDLETKIGGRMKAITATIINTGIADNRKIFILLLINPLNSLMFSIKEYSFIVLRRARSPERADYLTVIGFNKQQ